MTCRLGRKKYKLQCRYSRLASRYQGRELNVVDNASIEILGSAICMETEVQGNKEVTISFANAIARENNRGSVTAA